MSCFTVVLGCLNILRLERVRLGRNHYAILAGILFPASFDAFNHLAYFSHQLWWPREVFAALGTPISWLSWLILLWGMWRYDPPGSQLSIPENCLNNPRTREVTP